MAGGNNGRKHTHERDTNDATIIGATLDIDEAHISEVRKTNQKGMSDKCRRDYRNRIKRICKFWEEKYPEYYANGVRDLSQAEMQNPDFFYWKNTIDIVYTGINVRFVQAFLADAKNKDGNKIVSHEQLRKFHDAIMWGSKTSGNPLPPSYYDGMVAFLNNYKKETIDAKRCGRLDEEECDPIPWSLFRIILTWCVSSCNIFLWVFSLLQWNCMSRSINIGVLSLHCFRLGEDSVICKFDKHKSDLSGAKMHDKNMYSNPGDPLTSINLALAVWFCLKQGQFKESANLFQDKDTKDGTASSRYCSQLTTLFSRFKEILESYIRTDHCNAHGVRKGSGTHAMSGTTCPASISSVANRGDWSLGKVLDVYWHFAEPGDTFLGRALAGMDPNSESFCVLPPHFNMENPMGDDDIKEAMELCFGAIINNWTKTTSSNPTSVLLRCFASMVYHYEWLIEQTETTPGHPFAAIPILNHPDLLRRLHSKVTISSDSKFMTATGIPPHIETARMCKRILEKCDATLAKVANIEATVKSAVKEAYEEKQAENGHLSAESMQGMFKDFKSDIKKSMQEEIQEVRDEIKKMRSTMAPVDESNEFDTNDETPTFDADPPDYCREEGQSYGNFTYDGRLHWHVPKDFVFPQEINMTTGWGLWLSGMPSKRIRPFRLFKKAHLPRHLHSQFLLHWKPIFDLMQSASNMSHAAISRRPTATEIHDSLEIGISYLRSDRLSYVFENKRKRSDTWAISTWSKHCARSMILQHGTENDKSHFPAEEGTRFNKARSTGLCKRKRKENLSARKRKTQRRTRETPTTATVTTEAAEAAARVSQPAGRVAQARQSDTGVEANFEAIFGTKENAAAIEPYLDRAAEVDEEEVHRLRAEQLRSRSAGASAEGSALFYRPPQNPPLTAAVVDQPKTILRKMGSGGFVSAQCHTCWMPSNHFCRAVVPNSNVSIEGREHESICGTLACMNCRSKWPGEPEDYANRCVVHKR
jgi:hypothetical protein